MANNEQKPRPSSELVEYLTGKRDGLRRTIKAIEKDLAKIEAELQAAAFAAGKEQRT